MTAVARPKRSGLARLLRTGRSIVLFTLGGLIDVVCVMNVPGAAVLTGGDDPQATVTPLGALLVLLVIACWATVFVRRGAPVAVLVAGGLLMIFGISYLLLLVGAFEALTRWPRRTVLIAAATVASVTLFVIREVFTGWGHALGWMLGSDPSGDEPAWGIASVITALLPLGVFAGLVAYRRAREQASLSQVQAAEQHERAEALDEQLTRQAERERIARDLHDGLGHRLSSMALAAGAFETQAAAAPGDPALADWARLVRRQAHAALEDVRGVVGGLRSDTPGASAAPPASMRLIGQLVADLRAAGHRLDAYVFVDGTERVSPTLDATTFRIVQESLTNAIKHAPGAPVSVLVDAASEAGIRIRIVNPLVPASTGVPGGRRGIEGIRERAASAGGTAWIGPSQGQFIVDVSLPWA